MEKVLIAGAGGYLGIPLVKKLLELDFHVIGVDRYYFGQDLIPSEILNRPNFRLKQKDIRSLDLEDFKGVDAVIDLAGLSNDPSCDLRPDLTYNINLRGGENVATMAKKAGVPKYVFSSSCSVYGSGGRKVLSEESELLPVSSYAKAKIDIETHLGGLADDSFKVTCLRCATLFGMAPRMRFDLIINIMAFRAWRDRKIFILGGGKQWRPLVHVEDVATAFTKAVENQDFPENPLILNVGASENNFQVFQVANMAKEILTDIEIVKVPDDPDKRSYNVSFEKIKKQFDFVPEKSPKQGFQEIISALSYGALDPEDRRWQTTKYYEFLMDVEQTFRNVSIDGKIF
tara:strand:- start:11466 stop:12497 length:1032 start_codon:yes stop_codon:yes gene_type:complete